MDTQATRRKSPIQQKQPQQQQQQQQQSQPQQQQQQQQKQQLPHQHTIKCPSLTGSNGSVGFISMNEFLDFLKITCQVNETINNNNCDKTIDYHELAKNEVVNNLMARAATRHVQANSEPVTRPESADINGKKDKSLKKKSKKSKDSEARSNLDPALNEKLDEVINEGVLDSVLPYICPPTSNATATVTTHTPNNCPSKTKLNTSVTVKTPHEINRSNSKTNIEQGNGVRRSDSSKTLRRKSIQSINGVNDIDVIIHVCDEVKGVSRDFTCPQKLLVSKMGYFADVTSGQRLEDMDISVHCDLQIFEWLMKWVKRDNIVQEQWPTLDPSNVVPILVSASFLQMEPLLLDCLSFCHAHLNDVVKTSANLSCLNDNIITRLAAMFTNLELEMVKDKKERVTPRLWAKLIQSLCEPEPQALRGHYASLADLYKCSHCEKHVTQTVSSYIHCIPQNMRLNRWGQLISQHTRDQTWNITTYVTNLQKELRSWRKVYWRLWGNCHFLYCATCEMHFPTCQMNWCLYHPEQPQFLGPVTEGRMAGPAGRYPCCGQQAFRFETIAGPIGCQFREHTVLIDSDRDRAILKLAQIAEEGGCLYQPPPPRDASKNETLWTGMSLTPTSNRQGLLPTFTVEENRPKPFRNVSKVANHESSSETESNESSKKFPIYKKCSMSSDGCESDYSSPRPAKHKGKNVKRKAKPVNGRLWSGNLSARSNQDNQREYEEKAIKQVIAMVGKKTGNDMDSQLQNYYQGGTYVRLESEWRENNRQKASGNGGGGNGKTKGMK